MHMQRKDDTPAKPDRALSIYCYRHGYRRAVPNGAPGWWLGDATKRAARERPTHPIITAALVEYFCKVGYAVAMNEQYMKDLSVGKRTYGYYDLARFAQVHGVADSLPNSVKILMESLLHHVNGREITEAHIANMARYNPQEVGDIEFPFKPARVLLQDFTGVPCVVDLAAMRSAMAAFGGDPRRINPEQGVDLVIDHSIQVDHFNSSQAALLNAELEFQRNRERYELLRWGQASFDNFSVIPPASGICHQVNLEYIGKVVQTSLQQGQQIAYFDSCVGTDSHTPMINGLGVVGFGVGGIEAEAAMLGQPIGMLAPSVVGVKLTGALQAGITATDLVLRITEMLRAFGVVGKFVEFYGQGLSAMSVPDRATISNMAPEYGATVGYFPVDARTLEYMYDTGRDQEGIALVEAYCRAQGVFRDDDSADPQFESSMELDLGSVEPSMAGPKRPQDRVPLTHLKEEWQNMLTAPVGARGYNLSQEARAQEVSVSLADGQKVALSHGAVVIAAITSCTNTSNPSVLVGAGLLAKRAVELGLQRKPWVKTSFAPGSVVVTEYLQRTGLMTYLEQVGFYLVGYGCTTCIGNSGPLPEEIAQAVVENDLIVAGVLSGNRNFEGRVNPHTKANFLASPPLVVAYALAGTVALDITRDPIGQSADGRDIFLRDLWPEEDTLRAVVKKALNREEYIKSYAGLEQSNDEWNAITLKSNETYEWSADSSYIQHPPFFKNMPKEAPGIAPIDNARVLVRAGDSITTDHISPAGAIDPQSVAGKYLLAQGIDRAHFNSYGSRRGNDEVMARGTFANIRFRNLLTPQHEGSHTIYFPDNEQTDIYSAAQKYIASGTPTIVLAGKDYGMGSSRDWAAKGPFLLGIKAVIAVSYERIHRSNLIGMGILPLQFVEGQSADTLGLDGSERFCIPVDDGLAVKASVTVRAVRDDGSEVCFEALCRIDSPIEVAYYKHGGILQFVLRKFL